MDYLINDMLSSSKRASSKSRTTSPSPSSPPLPPTPTLSRKRKSKSVKFPENPGTNAASDTKAPETPAAEAAEIALPPTPAPSSTELPSAEAPKVTSPEPITTAVTDPAQTDYFSAAAPPRAQDLLSVPSATGETEKGASAFFTPASELPLPVAEMSQPEAEVTGVEGEPTVVKDKGDEPRVVAPGLSSEVEDADNAIEDPTTTKDIPADGVESPPPVLHLSQTPTPVVHSQPAILIGISGSPASGKTTMAHLLSLALRPAMPCFLIHQNDFSNPKHLLVPEDGDMMGLDSRHIINFSLFKRALDYSKCEGRLPPSYSSQEPEDDEAHARSEESAALLESLQDNLLHVPAFQDGRPVGIVEGPYLYQSETVRDLLDVKVFLRTSKSVARRRYFERMGEQGSGNGMEYWDFADSFDHNVWRNHTREHEVLFEHGDIEARPNLRLCGKVGIAVQPALDMDLAETLQWVIGQVKDSCTADRDSEHSTIEADFEACDCSEGLLGKIRKRIFDIL
ncbi:MAG: hypothetical protein Q9183_005326 [Haloplaca sp. 2 TL-2023]